MNKLKITSFSWEYFQKILKGNIRDSNITLSKKLIEFLWKGIIKTESYFCFDCYKDHFPSWGNWNEMMYTEYIQNKTYISWFFYKKPSLRTMSIIGKIIVDAFIIEVQEKFPENDIIIFCMINKQRNHDVWISLYEYRDGCDPILEPYTENIYNSYYLRRTNKSKILNK